MIRDSKIPFAYDKELLEGYRLKQYLYWDYTLFPNLLVLGNSGSGKSYLLRLILGHISATFISGGELTTAKAWIADYKNEILSVSAMRFYGYKDTLRGFDEFYSAFEARLSHEDSERSFQLLVIDEYVSWLASMDKKEAEEIKKRMATLLFMVRSLNMHVILGCQRGMAENFSFGSRDCLNVIFLGAPSRESVHSFVDKEAADVMKPCVRGQGYACFDGKQPQAFIVPKVTNFDEINAAIMQLVN
ncbi:hypothetical protein FACS189490_04800 [Clostridia bacterium]|nr:hypothetical protein FACS189490_04800 [Clostridia bacterium]